MQLDPTLWIAGSYYVEWDHQNQLRIVGPDNHLYLGSIGMDPSVVSIRDAGIENGELVLHLHIDQPEFLLVDPAMGHIRKVRLYIEVSGKEKPTFEQVLRDNPGTLNHNYLAVTNSTIAYRREYDGNFYGVEIDVPKGATIKRDDKRHGFKLKSAGSSFDLTLRTATSIKEATPRYVGRLFEGSDLQGLPPKRNQRFIEGLVQRTQVEVSHLVRNNKTSGFGYGTVFPRDWMEAADLGAGDLNPSAIAYMYHKSLEFTDTEGEGWHENIVGEFASERRNEIRDLAASLDALIDEAYPSVSLHVGASVRKLDERFISRNMVDIEPHYILGLTVLPIDKWSAHDLGMLRVVAKYVMAQARAHDLITFKKIPPTQRRFKQDEYYGVGNWRDSVLAYKQIHPVIAPYDVNVVFYPTALQVLSRHASALGIDQVEIDALVQKWSGVKDKYKFINPDGTSAYALALYGVRQGAGVETTFSRLEVNHTDEAYDLYYGKPSEEDVGSFARRLLDPAYFYTHSGPTIVGRGDGYDTTQYHGEVIWTKQTAYVVAGLARQLTGPSTFSHATRELVRKAAWETAHASIEAFQKMGAVPELHYDRDGTPHLYDDQPKAEGPMNKVQLWSAVGARRILRVYSQLSIDRARA